MFPEFVFVPVLFWSSCLWIGSGDVFANRLFQHEGSEMRAQLSLEEKLQLPLAVLKLNLFPSEEPRLCTSGNVFLICIFSEAETKVPMYVN